MEQADLKIQVGETLQLQRRDGGDSARLYVRLIGYLPGVSLLVTTPEVDDKVMIIREGQPYVVRMMIDNRIVGFTTSVLRSSVRPFPYLHLSYPEEMEQITVRTARRVRVKLFASVTNENPDFKLDKPRSATIIDISTSGALLTSGEKLGEVGDVVIVSCALKIGNAEKLLILSAVIRNLQIGESEDGASVQHQHGLELNLKNQQDVFALHGYVYGQIVKAQSE